MTTVGILALQGGFQAHANSLKSLNNQLSVCFVKKPEQLLQCDGLIIPGGESSTLLKLLTPDFIEALQVFNQQKKPIFGTCAGLILLARNVHPKQFSLNFIDVDVERNAYGTQINSFQTKARVSLPAQENSELDFVFIRAPKIKSIGSGVKILAVIENEPVFVQQNHVLAATFHPELSIQTTIHRYFLEMHLLYHKAI